ncbi:MAG: helix-hairpin-helix domain-containing protein [Akkermansiaceae bacterium]
MNPLNALALLASLFLASLTHAAPLTKIENCTLIKTEWADGDSFRVQIPFKPADKNGPGHKAREITIRLYGADCIESKIHSTTDGRRVRAQRRYFGISKVGNAKASTNLALSYGAKATEETRQILSKPFTVYTSFADARGSAQFKRVYGFVVTADGKDLASLLVSKGLARAFGVSRETFDLRTSKEYKAHLTDLELQAAKKGVGAWERTDWDKLPAERRAQREDDMEDKIGIAGKKQPPEKPIHINKAARDELMQLPSIGEKTANLIIEGRPYQKPEDLLKVDGIGKKTLEKLKPHLIFPKQ